MGLDGYNLSRYPLEEHYTVNIAKEFNRLDLIPPEN